MERQLGRVAAGGGSGLRRRSSGLRCMQVGADEAGEGERAVDRRLRGLGQAQQQEGDQRDGDLDADGVFAGAEEAA